MKIEKVYSDVGLVNTHGESAVNKKTEKQPEAIEKQERPGISGSQVNLSKTSVDISKVTANMDNQVPERIAKINALKKQVQEGTYNIDAGDIADKMIKESLEDIG